MVQEHLLNFNELLTGEGNQLRYVKRFSTSRTVHQENIAEHSFFTAFFSLVIGRYASDKGYSIDMGLLAQKALFHDIEEQFTGDIIRPVKYHSGKIKEDLDFMSNNMVMEFFHSIFIKHPLSVAYFYNLWKNAKDDSYIEGRILRFADFCSVLSYLHQEVRGGNSLIMRNVNGLEDHLKTFNNTYYDFIRELVMQAEDILIDIRRAQ